MMMMMMMISKGVLEKAMDGIAVRTQTSTTTGESSFVAELYRPSS
jgi:hypothetical protein